MGFKMKSFFIICLLAIHNSYGCTMDGVAVWQLPIVVGIEDYHEGIIFERGINNIGGFTLTSYNDLNSGPYVDAAIENSAFVLRTNEAYREYEENETSDIIILTFTFSCTNGVSLPSPLTIRIEINDNNNNPPLFKTSDTAASAATTYEFTIAPPVPPGFLITNCVSDIIVRDIDLTTYRIEFGIEDNPYFEIAYDEAASTDAKEFKALLSTTTFIRSIPEPIILTISATDVDQTAGPPITRNTTVTILGSSEFELPAEPVFSQAFYFASYTETQVTLEQSISLQQGYDELVQFSLEGDYAVDHFAFTVTSNQVILSVTNPLPTEVLQEAQIYLVVRAAREYTSGASATIVVQLPEEVRLEFERPHYEGEILDNNLQLAPLILSQGYQGSDINVTVEDYGSFFTASVAGNIITLSMTPLDLNIIQENNFINLRVTASSASGAATAIVTLDIVKDDVTTPAFDRPLYTGTYDSTTGLAVDSILLIQGYDETVNVSLSGEYESYFELVRDGPSSTLRVAGAGLPSHILSESHLLLSVQATKPRTVGANAAVSVTLPGARELQFEATSYKGSLRDNILTIDTIILSVGYDVDVTFSLSGDYSTSFAASNVQNQVSIYLPTQLPQEIISENNFLMLTLNANGLNALPATTAVLIEIVKDDATTPVFSQTIYYGTYLGSSSIDIANINLIQGYDNSVAFRIQGENSDYFSISPNGNSVTLTVQSGIPEEVVFREKTFVFNILADKPLTVGANAAIVIKFDEDLTEPTIMQFSQNTYIGSLEHNLLTLEGIVLETGFAAGTQFQLIGDYAAAFAHTVTNNIITLSLTSELPSEILENNKFIVLELEARRDRAVSVVAGIIIDLVQEEIVIPVFSQAFYSGIYTEDNALQFQETVTLTQGFDETVTFGLEGESAVWFAVVPVGNSLTIASTSDVPQDVLDSHHQLLFSVVAYKPNTINGYAAISIDLPKDILEQEVLRFFQSSYEGRLDGPELQVPTIILSNEITDNVLISLSGAYATYFNATRDSNIIHIDLMNDLPSEVISNNEFIVLDIIASKLDAISGYTALILSLVKEPTIVTPVFEQPYYTGEISEQGELLFEHTMRLIQGFDESVSFTLNGDGSELFNLTQSGLNSLSLSITESGIEEININHLIFSVVAIKAGSISGQAAIVIHNADSSTPRTLSFSQNYYKGSLEENLLTMESISIVEGYNSDVQLTLSGDYVDYFQLVGQDGTFTLQLLSNIPNEIIEANNVLVYAIEAYTNDARSHATVIVELIKDDVNETEALTFDEAFFIGSYSATSGVMSDIQLRVVTGYDNDILFNVEGGMGTWFNVEHAESIVTINLLAPLPVELFIDNQLVIFALNAVNSAGKTATATIIVTLEGDVSDLTVLAFERNNYLGTIESGNTTLEAIILTQGYSSEVHYTLQGDLSEFFGINQEGPTLNVILHSAIPEQVIPANRILVIVLQATATQAISATTTIVFEIVAGQGLAFNAAYYVGQYSEAEGLVFEPTIALDFGYDQEIQFALEGDHAQWFDLEVQGNAVTLTTAGAIPPAILVNNHQLVFIITAQKPGISNIASATIVISLVDDYTDAPVLGFEQASYLGAIDNGILSIDPIVLSEGYTDAVAFTIHGDLASYFNPTQQGSTVNIVLLSIIPDQALPANGIVLLELRASAPQAVPATTTIVIETQRALAVEELTFSAGYYIGQFSETEGFAFDTIISLDVGYDEDVQFALDGEHAQWFDLEVQGNTVTVTMSGAIPPAILVNNHQLVFIINAQKPGISNIASATIVISLVDDFTDAPLLGFEQASYLGAIDNGIISIDPIVLSEGYTDAVAFTIHGDLASYFNLTPQGSTVNIVLLSIIPDQALPANGIVLLELRASAPQAVPATTTIVIETQRALAVEELTFSAGYYIGQFSETEGFAFDTIISLDVGYDEDVQFALDGEHAQWFDLEVQGNTVTVTMTGAIPPAILVNNHQLVFIINAQKPGISNIASATIVISLVDDFTDAPLLGFEQASYLGAIDNGILSIDPIVLSEGYTDAVAFTIHGDLASYFNLTQQGSTVNIVLLSIIPDQALPANGIVLLELRASAPQAVPATTTIVIETQRALAVEELTFSAGYYIGQFSETEGFAFDTIISLDVGYDEDVQFALDGEHAQWFDLEVQGNTVTVTMTDAIPPAILVNNHQLVFIITAQKPGISNIASATIVISLVDDFTDAPLLGYEQASYLGAIDNGILSIDPIVLSEGYTDAVAFTIHGDLASYFNPTQQGSTVNIVLLSIIPDQALPANGIVLLELRASAPQAVPATTTIVIETQRTLALEELTFSAGYYIGEFSETEGFAFDTIISLDVGYDEDVQFSLDGEHAQWFDLEVQGNTVTVTMTNAIPPAILVNNHQLVFIITAQKPGISNIASATIVISLVDDFTDAPLLGYEQASYLGAIDNGILSIDPIVLSEGYTDAVAFTIHGDLASYFNPTQQGSTVNIVLLSIIPDQALPANGIVLLELRASAPQAVPATTTIVIETQRTLALEELTFSAGYYIGQFSETEGFAFDTIISLDVGYDEDVQFSLDGEHAQWFDLEVQGNTVTVTMTDAIPPAILVNNHQLVFIITAQKPGISNIASATIVISLVDDFSDAPLLGFEQASYLGAIDNGILSIDPIVLSEGYTDAVAFTIHGDLASYFNPTQQGSTVNIVLLSIIPDQALPANGIVLLELRASAPQAVPATTTIVIETQRALALEELTFSAGYYIGQFSETEGFAFDTIISLDVGYDEDVQFALDGEHAQWFDLEVQGNTVTVTMTGAIPPVILVNNHQLVFIITAQKPGISNIASATIVISLVDDFTDAPLLGFEQASYLGAIDNGILSIDPIVLSEGYTDAVAFTIHGDLASYFNPTQQGSTVNIVLLSIIPDQALPANGIVLLELRASAPQAVPATTTIVIETQRTLALEELTFSAGYYIGQFSETEGFAFDTIISLDVGYDEDVQFALDGEHAQWFDLEVQGNTVTVTMTGAIPPAILVNNHQLVFIITAQKPDISNIASATIVISLVDDFTDAPLLGFEQASYLGAIDNGIISIDPIVLSEGYTDAVAFTIHGDLASYFNPTQQGSTVNIVLLSIIPDQALPANGIVLLELRASAPQAVPATTTIVIETQRTLAVEELTFSAGYYIGQFSETEGFAFDTIISLDVGYDEDVQFALDGEHAQWFDLEVQGNTVTVTMTGAIPPAILVNNHQLVFIITAQKPGVSNIASATIVISLVDDFTDAPLLGFEQASYLGAIDNGIISIDPIVLSEGYTDAVAFTIHGDLASYFNPTQQGSTVNIVLLSIIPDQALPANGIVLLELRASAPQAVPATTTIVIETQRTLAVEELTFSAGYYIGQFSETEGFAFDTIISLDVGYDEDVQFALDGEHAQWFDLEVQGNTVTVTMSGAIPPAILVNNHQLVFIITAQKPGVSNIASATIVISLVDDFTDAPLLGFEQASYLGAIDNGIISIDPIVLSEGYTDAVAFTIHGDLASYFNPTQQGSTVNIVLLSIIPDQALPANGIVLLELRASAPQAVPATTTIVIETQRALAVEELTFSAGYYIGQFSETEGFAFDTIISLDVGYDEDVQFALDGEHAQWFDLEVQGNTVTVTMTGVIPPAILVNNHQLVFIITAQKPGISNIASATIVISLVDDYTDAPLLGFEQASYLGAIDNGILSIDPIVLSEGYTDAVAFTIYGDLASYFNPTQQGSTVNIVLQSVIPDQVLPANGIVLLELRASAPQAVPATTTVVVEARRAVAEEDLAFSAAYYTGQYSETEGVSFDTIISLDVGYNVDVDFALEGELAQWFIISAYENAISIYVVEPIPPAELVDVRKIIMTVRAYKPGHTASAVVVISVIDDSGSSTNEAFSKVLYEGTINLNVVQHEPITITGYTGGEIEIFGVYGELFSASVSGDTVVVGASGTLALPVSVTHVALELRTGGASAALIFDVIQSETPELPTVVFGSSSYVLRAEMTQTGLVGQISASASNGENVAYSLALDNAHLRERISINSQGEIHLSAPTNTGVYSFEAIATSSITQVQATALVQLTVEVVATCGDDQTLPPLIIIDRDEEEPHENLVVLDSVAQAGCRFRLTNRWPLDQDWLYVDDTGLHARSIDREDPRIAFMALSQVQVELVLECDSDTQTRTKRSITNPRLDWLGPYEYGSNRWILTDTILYNSRRSFVNLIVNDINDNYPIFVGNQNVPIVCGYPIPELEDVVLPRALAELKATDADVGENAALSFWSTSELLAVSSTTGSVHVRDGASLSHDQILTVSVTDLNGREDGLTTSIQLMVKLIDTSHIAVVTVRNAFLDQEETILSNISSAVGYEVKVLSSAVISDDTADSANARRKRDITAEGASLQLYVYGVIDREPVAVTQLANDITENLLAGVDVTRTISLEDYLEGREINGGAGRDTGLLVATIVLSVLLFILILAIAVWCFLRWRKARNYEQFSDANSIASRNETLDTPPKLDSLKKPRLNIDELKRSERRLQEMLDAPIEEVAPKAQTSQVNPEDAFDTIINIAPTDTTLPIVIQSIDKLKDDTNSADEDEFGERSIKNQRKSVVTFNENVEKIIHVEDIPGDDSTDVEVFKF